MILGFTGTRNGMTPPQRAALRSAIATLPASFLHGGAIGADTEADAFVVAADIESTCRIEVYPSSAARESYWAAKPEPRLVHVWREPLARNQLIVERCDALLACPAIAEEVLRSGTWTTVRRARKLRRPVTIIAPDGTIAGER